MERRGSNSAHCEPIQSGQRLRPGSMTQSQRRGIRSPTHLCLVIRAQVKVRAFVCRSWVMNAAPQNSRRSRMDIPRLRPEPGLREVQIPIHTTQKSHIHEASNPAFDDRIHQLTHLCPAGYVFNLTLLANSNPDSMDLWLSWGCLAAPSRASACGAKVETKNRAHNPFTGTDPLGDRPD